MNELLKTLDETVFTPELTSKIQELYESKITDVVNTYEAKLQEAEIVAESRIQYTEAKAQEYADLIKEEYSAKLVEETNMVKEEYSAKVNEYTEYVKSELSKDVDAYLSVIVEEFVEENRIAIDESVQSAKVKAILEGFDSLLVTTGVSLSQIVEAKNEGSTANELESMKSTVNKLVKENAQLKANLVEKTKQAVIECVSSDMSLVQKDKFLKLAEMAVYTGSEDEYKAKLQNIVETISSIKDVAAPILETVVENVISDKVTKPVVDHKRFF